MSIILLADAKTHLNIASSNTTFDAELQTFIDAAAAMWVQRVGPVESTAYVDAFNGGVISIAVRHYPLLTVTAVTEMGVTLTANVDYQVDIPSGVITRTTGFWQRYFLEGINNVTVSYTAGYAAVPADIKLANKLIVQHMWETTRGSMNKPGQLEDQWQPKMGYIWPHRVEEIAQGYRLAGIA